jgi:hypothetical protein
VPSTTAASKPFIEMPALLTSACTGPNCVRALSANACTLASSVTSSCAACTTPALLRLAAACSACAKSRAVSTTLYRCCASCRHVSSPKPRLPPVTIAYFGEVFDM